jgi:hypothetical protein
MGGYATPQHWHHICLSIARALETAAKTLDQELGKHVTTHQQALSKLRKEKPMQWRKKVIAGIVKRGTRRTAAHREQSMRFVEEIQHVLSTKRRHSFALMDTVGFKEHVKKRQCTSSDASEEWEAAISDPAIRQEVEDGEVVIAVKEWTRLIGDSGTARNRSLVLDEDLPDAAAGAAALQKLRQLGSFGDHHSAESGGGVVAQSRGFVARGATSASKRVPEVASPTRRAFEQLVSGFLVQSQQQWCQQWWRGSFVAKAPAP